MIRVDLHNISILLQQEKHLQLPYELSDLPLTSSQEYGWLARSAVQLGR